jgi:O-antigen/teichoic acid export membrane protein
VLQLTGLAWLGASGRLSAASAHAAAGLACAVAGGAWLVRARRHFAVTWNEVGRDLRRSWSFGKWVFGGQLTAVVNGYLAHWLLLPILGAAATGALAACTTVVSLSNPLLIGIGNVLGPRTARAAAEGGGAEVRRVVRTTTLLLGGLMAVFVALVWLFGGWLLEWLYGRAYAGYELTAVVLAAATLAGAIGMSADHGLRALGRPETAFKASVLALVVTLAVVLALVGPWKVLGAAGGMLVGSVAGAAVRWVAFRRLTAAGEGDDAR